jgi:hypothetical protein
MRSSHLKRRSEHLERIYLNVNVKIYFLVSQELKKLFGASKLICLSAEITNIYYERNRSSSLDRYWKIVYPGKWNFNFSVVLTNLKKFYVYDTVARTSKTIWN